LRYLTCFTENIDALVGYFSKVFNKFQQGRRYFVMRLTQIFNKFKLVYDVLLKDFTNLFNRFQEGGI
jgi:hypothetical protein